MACGALEDRAGGGELVQAAASAALAGSTVGIDSHVVEGRGAARAGLEGPAVLQDRQAQPRVHVHRRAQTALRLFAAPEAAQRRAGRCVRADEGDLQALGELTQQLRTVVTEPVRDRQADSGGRVRLALRPDHRQGPVQRPAHLRRLGGGAQRHRDPGAQRAGEVHAGQREPVRVDRAADRPAGLIVQSQQGGALAALGLRESGLAQQAGGEQALDRVGDRRRGHPELAGDLHPAGLGASTHDLEDRGIGGRRASLARGAHCASSPCSP